MQEKLDIIQAQQKYLETNDPQYVELLYKQIVSLCAALIKRQRAVYTVDKEDLLDIASDVCIRLMSTKKMVIKSAQSAFLRKALYNKRTRQNENSARCVPLECLAEQSRDSGDVEDYDDYVDRLLTDEYDDDIDMLVKQTVLLRLNWHKVWRSLPNQKIKDEYKRKMKEVQQCVKESVPQLDAVD